MRLLRSLQSLAAVAALIPALAPAQPAATARAVRRAPPTLVVFLTVDQLRPDYLERFGAQLTGGLGRLYRGGAVFTHAFQDHAITETAPGHAATLSGRFPRSTGIVTNSAGVYDPQAPLLEAQGAPASPYRFRGSTLTDWLRIRDARSRALSVSRKDRGAILPLGRAKQQVFWYAANGTFTTSRYYADTLPSWVRAFNARHAPATLAGATWTLLLAPSQYPEPDSVAAEAGGQGFVFPHRMSDDPAMAAAQLPEFPLMDERTLALALAGLDALNLGRGPHADVLAISLSTTDAVGHKYGPDSRELHDQVLQLDRFLGAFLDSLYRVRDSSTIVIALTADHGVAPLPEVKSRDPNAGARHVELSGPVHDARAALASKGADSLAFRFEDGVAYLDRTRLTPGVNADDIIRRFAAAARNAAGVLRVDSPLALAKADTVTDDIARRWLHMFPPDLRPDLVVTLKPWSVWGETAYAMHGSPHDYDAHVPVIFYGAGIRPGRYDAFARVVDMAPTLARVVGVLPTEPLDGRVLQQALNQR